MSSLSYKIPKLVLRFVHQLGLKNFCTEKIYGKNLTDNFLKFTRFIWVFILLGIYNIECCKSPRFPNFVIKWNDWLKGQFDAILGSMHVYVHSKSEIVSE